MKDLKLDDLIVQDASEVRRIIADRSPTERNRLSVKSRPLYEVVVTELSKGTRNTGDQIKYLETFETTLGVFRAASYSLRKEMNILGLEQTLGARESLKKEISGETGSQDALIGEISDAVLFSNRYALAFAGNVGLALLGAKKADVQSLFSFGTKYDRGKDKNDHTYFLADLASNSLTNILFEKRTRQDEISDNDFHDTLQSVFTSWINQFDWKILGPIAEKRGINDIVVRYKDYSMKQGQFKERASLVVIDDRIMNCRKPDVIGGQDLGEILWQNMIKLSAFDLERGENPHSPASSIFVYGDPGCGKTFNAHAQMRSFAELCKEKGLPFWALTHSTTDYASHFQNQTANALAELARKIKDFRGPVVMYVADADNIFQSRKSPNLTAEQQQTLAVYFKMFDGQLIPRNGKFMAVMDANYVDGIDDATKSRVFDEIVHMKRFEKPEQFAEYSRRMLTKGLEGNLLTDGEWLEIGKCLLETPLSNREIEHVLKGLRRGFPVPEEMIGQSYEAHVELRNKQLKGLTTKAIIGKVEDYVSERMEIERESARKKKEESIMRFLTSLNEDKNATKVGP